MIKGPTHPVVFSAQFFLPYAHQEVAHYIETLGKPVERFIISHIHPEHYYEQEI